MFRAMTAAHRYIVSETLVSAAINTIIGIVAMLLIFGIQPAAPLWGTHGVGINLVPAVFMMSLMDVIVPTLLTRTRIRRGRLTIAPSLPKSTWLPKRVALRALLLATALTAVLLPCTLVVLNWWGPSVWSLSRLFASQALLGVLVAIVIIPIALRAAFDERRTSEKPRVGEGD
jgi:hypothetical protein